MTGSRFVLGLLLFIHAPGYADTECSVLDHVSEPLKVVFDKPVQYCRTSTQCAMQKEVGIDDETIELFVGGIESCGMKGSEYQFSQGQLSGDLISCAHDTIQGMVPLKNVKCESTTAKDGMVDVQVCYDAASESVLTFVLPKREGDEGYVFINSGGNSNAMGANVMNCGPQRKKAKLKRGAPEQRAELKGSFGRS